MNFYYDPILGLQYTYLGEYFLIDIEMLPQDFNMNTEELLKYIRQIGVQLVDSTEQTHIERVLNITEYKL